MTELANKDVESVDDIYLDIWELVNKIIQQQTLLESWMKGGFMNIAKARYVMGQHSVGSDQLPAGDREITAGLLVTRSGPEDQVTFSLQRQPGAGGATDPLRWFSALPPGALRDAQRQFDRAAEVGGDLASLRSQLLSAMARLERARARSGTEDGGTTSRITEAVDALTIK